MWGWGWDGNLWDSPTGNSLLVPAALSPPLSVVVVQLPVIGPSINIAQTRMGKCLHYAVHTVWLHVSFRMWRVGVRDEFLEGLESPEKSLTWESKWCRSAILTCWVVPRSMSLQGFILIWMWSFCRASSAQPSRFQLSPPALCPSVCQKLLITLALDPTLSDTGVWSPMG